MEENKNKSNIITKESPQLKLQELYKYYQDQDSNKLFEDISPSKRKKYLEQIKKNQKIKYNNMKNRYNQQSSNNDEDNESIKKNKSCPRFDDIILNQDLNYKYPNQSYYNILSSDFNDNRNKIYDYNNSIPSEPMNANQKICKNNSDYIGDDDIFIRIVPNFGNNTVPDKENNSSIPCNNFTLYNNKTYDLHQKRIPKNSSFIYHKSKTPTKKCIFHKKKKINDYNNNNNLYDNISVNSNVDSNLCNNGSTYNDYDINSLNSKKLYKMIKSGVKFDMEKDKKNDYIDLLTISDIKNMAKQKKLKNLQKSPYNKQKNKEIINYTVVPNIETSPINITSSHESSETFSKDEYNVKTFPKRKNNFMFKKSKNNKKYSNNNENRNLNKSYDCVVFKKKIGVKNKKNKRNKTSDLYYENKGTPIKKENMRGGIVVLYPNKFKNNNNIIEKLNNNNNDNNIPVSDYNNNNIYIAITIIEKWWKKVIYKRFKKIIEIIITKKYKTYKKNKPKNLYISKDYYKIPSNEIILIQNKFKDYIKLKNNKNSQLNNYVKYIPKNICYISKLRLNPPNPPKNKHRYTESKLFQSNINKILLSGTEIKYETNNYTYFKKCHFRRRSNSDEEDEYDIDRRAFTCEIMRKIKIKPDRRELTPDIKKIKNPNLKVVKLFDTQYLTNKRKKKKKNKENKENKENDDNKNNGIKNENKKDDKINKVNNNIKKYDEDNLIKDNIGFNNYQISYINYKKNIDKNNPSINKDNIENGGKFNNNNRNQNLKKYENNIIDEDDKNDKKYNNNSYYNSNLKNDKIYNNSYNNSNIKDNKIFNNNSYYNSNEKEIKDNDFKNNLKNNNNDQNMNNRNYKNNINNYSNKNENLNQSLNNNDNNKIKNINDDYYNNKKNDIIENINDNYYNNENNKPNNENFKIKPLINNHNDNDYNNIIKDNNDKYNNNSIKFIQPNKKEYFDNNNNFSYKNINKRNNDKNNLDNDKEKDNNEYKINFNNINENDKNEYKKNNNNINNDRDNYGIYNSKYSNKNNIQNKDNNHITNYKPIEITQYQVNEIIIKKPENYKYYKVIKNPKKEYDLHKVIKIQRNVRKFLEKIYPKIKSVKKTYLTNYNKNDNLSDSIEHKYYNNNIVYINRDNKTNFSRAELRENGKNKNISINDSRRSMFNNSNLEYSNDDEPDKDIKKNNETDSLRTISINIDNLDNNKINELSLNNSLLNENSINSMNNNIKKYINNPVSNYNSYAESSHRNTLNGENNGRRSINRAPDSTASKRIRTSSSLKSLPYKYNKTSYNEYIKYLLKDNYMNYAISQINNIARQIKYYSSVYILKMLTQRIIKVMQQFVFYILKGEGFVIYKNVFFNIIKTYIKNKDLYINNNNDISKLLKDTILYYHKIYNKYNYIPYIKPNDEKKLIHTQLFNNDINFNNLISFICNYLNIEKKVDNFSPELVKYYLMKRPLKNFNIFTITRYINSLHYILIFNSFNTNNLINKNKNKNKNKFYQTFNDILKQDNLKSTNTQFNKDFHYRSLSHDDNKSFNLNKINTIYSMKKKIGLNREGFINLGNSTYDNKNSINLMKKKNNESLINREIVNQIYEDFNNNKKYMKKRSMNYEKVDKFKIKRHVARLSSSNIINDSLGKVKIANNSLVKKKFIYMKKIK